MSGVILWTLGENASDSDHRFKEIANWWTELEGKNVGYRHVHGIQTNLTVEEQERLSSEESFTIQNPQLEDATLSFEKQSCLHNISVQGLDLDVEQNKLKVFSSDPHRHIFTELPAPGMGRFKRETMLF